MRKTYSKEEVSKKLKEIGWLKTEDIDKHPDLPSRKTIIKLFKTTKTNNVWKELGISFTSQPSYTKEEVAKKLKEFGWLKNKKIVKHPELPVVETICKLFETTKMSDVWKQLDISFKDRFNYTKEEVAKTLKEVGHLTDKKVGKHSNLPSAPTIVKLFNTTKMSDVWEELSISKS